MKRSCQDPFYVHLVFEYLLHIGLWDTVATLQEECGFWGLPATASDCDSKNLWKLTLMRYFDLKDQDSFFQVFKFPSFDPEMYSTDFKKLMADLCVYFATSDFAKVEDIPQSVSTNPQNVDRRFTSSLSYSHTVPSHSNSSAKPSILRLSNFLDKNCMDMSDDPDFEPYFSLCFASNLQNHHLFQLAHQDTWILTLRGRLKQQLWQIHPDSKVPDIVFYLPLNSNGNEEWTTQNKASHDGLKAMCCYPSNQNTHANNTQIDNSSKSVTQKFEVGTDNLLMSEFIGNESTFPSGFSSNLHHEFSKESDKFEEIHSHNSTLFIRRQNQQLASSTPNLSRGIMTRDKYHEKHEECRRHYSHLKNKFSKLHTDYHNLIGVASELTGALENTARGQQIDLGETLNNCLHIFPELFSQHQLIQKSETQGIKGRFSLRSTSCDWKLDITRIKRHLRDHNVKSRLLLMQSLRWAITKSSSRKRECIMNQFVECDLLNLQGDSLIKCLLAPPGVATPHPLQQSAARLLNTLASVQSGRSYLAQNSETVNVTSDILQQRDGIFTDLITKSMLVAALQKLSLRRNQRVSMIQSGMVQWLFQQMLNIDVQSSYSLEYGTALLMNLCLHQSAKEICTTMAESVMSVLINLLSTPVAQALPYINGILYSLLSHSVLNDTAAQLGLSSALEENLMKQDSMEIKKQMEHILQYHKSLLQNEDVVTLPLAVSEGEMMDEDNEELDLLGDELDEQDPVRNIKGELAGDDLLKAQFTLPNNSHENSEGTTLSDSEADLNSTRIIMRPTTPKGRISRSMVDQSEQVFSDTLEEYQNVKRSSLKEEKLTSEKVPRGPQTTNSVHETSLSELGQSFSRHLESNGMECHKSESFLVYQEDDKKTLPQIEIHPASNTDDADSDKNFENDDDSDDVQVGIVHVSHCPHSCPQTAANIAGLTEEGANDREPPPGSEGSETSAFTSRPKIPRTPPH